MPDRQKPDYKSLIDEETWSFIAQTNSFYPAETIDYTIHRQREIYDTMCRQFFSGYPDGVTASDDVINHNQSTVPVRRYTSANAIDNGKGKRKGIAHIVYFHGGGFVVGGLESHDDVCAELCDLTGLGVTSVDYRLSPEHKHPAAFEDSIACVLHESNRLQIPLLLCGDSAGGNLAAAVSHTVRQSKIENGLPAIAGQVLIYPGLGGDTKQGSYITHAQAPMLTTRDVLFYSDIRGARPAVTREATLAPLTDTDFSNLPKTIVVSAECDPLSDDGRNYCDAIESAGGNAEWFNESGLVHGYLRARHSVRRAQDSFNRIVVGLKMLAEGRWYNSVPGTAPTSAELY